MQQIKDDYRKILFDAVGKKIIGVFGDYKYQYDGVNGDTVIQAIAAKIAEDNEGYMVVTGKYHYVIQDGKMEKDESLNIELQKAIDNDFINNKQYSRILASACSYAIFLITILRSTYQIEEEEFLEAEPDNKIFGLGVCIIDKNDGDPTVDCGCFEIKTIENVKDTYCCVKIIKGFVGDCKGFFHPRSHSLIEPYIKNSFTELTATKDWKTIPDIFKSLKPKN